MYRNNVLFDNELAFRIALWIRIAVSDEFTTQTMLDTNIDDNIFVKRVWKFANNRKIPRKYDKFFVNDKHWACTLPVFSW